MIMGRGQFQLPTPQTIRLHIRMAQTRIFLSACVCTCSVNRVLSMNNSNPPPPPHTHTHTHTTHTHTVDCYFWKVVLYKFWNNTRPCHLEKELYSLPGLEKELYSLPGNHYTAISQTVASHHVCIHKNAELKWSTKPDPLCGVLLRDTLECIVSNAKFQWSVKGLRVTKKKPLPTLQVNTQ